jgi:hypothetical protein
MPSEAAIHAETVRSDAEAMDAVVQQVRNDQLSSMDAFRVIRDLGKGDPNVYSRSFRYKGTF